MTINAKNINQLEEASAVENGDLIPVYKDGTAKKAAAELFRGADGVGIQSVEETTVSTESGGVNIITVTMTDGTTATFSVKNGAKGDTGRAFQVVKTYASVAAMEADFSGTDTETGDFVMISSTVEDPDNAKLYVKGENAFTFVSDLSGQQGMKGDDGEDGTGIASITSGTDAQGNTTLTISLTDGTTQNFTISKGTDATINGVTTLTLTGTDGVTATQSGSTLTLSAPGIATMKSALSRMDLSMEGSGDPAVITDAASAPVRALSVSIDAVQAGSGGPYPPGGGKNQCPIEVDTATVNGVTFTIDANAGTVTVNGTASQTTTFFLNALSDRYTGNDWILSGCPTSGSLTTHCLKIFNNGNGYGTDGGSGIRFTGINNLRCGIVVYNGITVNQAIFQPMIRLASDTDPTFAPYSNVRPITGWTEATITRTGRNLFPSLPIETNLSADSRFTLYVQSDGGIRVNGTSNGNALLISNCYAPTSSDQNDFKKHLSNGNYKMIRDWALGTGINVQVAASKVATQTSVEILNSGSGSFTITDEYPYIWIRIHIFAGTYNNTVFYPMILLAEESDTSYEIPQSQSVTVSMGNAGTVYGGTLDVLSGTLTVTHKYVSARSVSWRQLSTYVYVNLADSSVDKAEILCNVAPYNTDYRAPFPSVWWGGESESNKNLCLGISDVTTSSSAWSSFLSEQDVQLVYKLATPITYTLTPAQLSTLAGTNVISADCGAVSVTYKGDPEIIFGS